jgi:SAM-dependent methyltransferase
MVENRGYVLGHADAEVERLQLQAQILEPFTRRLIRDSGIQPGMRVLDLGCGAGDVSMLLADAVGPAGTVIAIDREERAIDVARGRAAQAGYHQIKFVVGADEDLAGHAPFDAAIGRYVLIHQPDPALLVRRAAAAVRSGGIVAFQEVAIHCGTRIMPAVDLWRDTLGSVYDFARAAYQTPDAAGRLLGYFMAAGLPAPALFWEAPAGGAQSPYVQYSVATYRVVLPHIERLGFLRPGVGDPDTLYERLVAAMTAASAQFIGGAEASAWAIRP